MARSNEVITEQQAKKTEQKGAVEALPTDTLDDFFFHAANYLYQKRKLFISVGIAIFAVFLAGYGVSKYLDAQETTRNQELFKIEKMIYDEQLTPAEMKTQVFPALERFLAEHSDARQSILARFYRSGLFHKSGEYEKAQTDLEQALSELKKDTPLFVLGSIYLANVLRDQKKFDDAISVLKKAKSDLMADIVLMELSETYISKSDSDNARATLEQLINDFPKSQYLERAKQLLAML